jgi:hypothetical protein
LHGLLGSRSIYAQKSRIVGIAVAGIAVVVLGFGVALVVGALVFF